MQTRDGGEGKERERGVMVVGRGWSRVRGEQGPARLISHSLGVSPAFPCAPSADPAHNWPSPGRRRPPFGSSPRRSPSPASSPRRRRPPSLSRRRRRQRPGGGQPLYTRIERNSPFTRHRIPASAPVSPSGPCTCFGPFSELQSPTQPSGTLRPEPNPNTPGPPS